MIDKKILKAFTEASGLCYHDWLTRGLCVVNCKKCNVVLHGHSNQEWRNPVDIMAAIQNWPCKECDGKGYKISGGNSASLNEPMQYPCTCEKGKLNLWDDFMGWLWAHKTSPSDSGRYIAIALAAKLLNPESLMRLFLEFMGIEIEGNK